MFVIDSVITANKTDYNQTLLEKCKHKITRNKLENLINDDLDSSSSDNEYDSETND